MRIDHKPNQFVIRIKNKPVFPLPLIKKKGNQFNYFPLSFTETKIIIIIIIIK